MAISVLHDLLTLIVGLYILRFVQLRTNGTQMGSALTYLIH
jgi:hypothetical protein